MTMRPIKGDAETCISFLGADFVVSYDFTITSKGCPEVLYQRNGDPGWPAEAPEWEVETKGLHFDDHTARQNLLLEMPNWLAKLIDEKIRDLDDVRERIGRQLEDDR